jgi:hypothetical protein
MLSPNKVALIDAINSDQALTHRQWNQSTNRLAQNLRDGLGATKGDRVSFSHGLRSTTGRSRQGVGRDRIQEPSHPDWCTDPWGRVVYSAEEAAEADGELGYPVVVKALGVATRASFSDPVP